MNSYDKIMEDEDLIIFSPIFIFRRNKLKLSKANNFSNSKIKFHKKLIKANSKNEVEVLENKIKNFLTVMNSECKNFNSNIFYKNFRKTCFNLKELNEESKQFVDGSVKFSSFVNFFKLIKFSAGYHELLHLSSLKNTKNVFDPFNEGYTQLLEERYFNEAGLSYYFEVIIMRVIETIFGKDYLEKLYFSGNFHKLFHEFNNYIPYEKLVELLNDLKLIFYTEQNGDFNEKRDILQKKLNNTYETLFCCFVEKNKSNLEYLKNESLKRIWCSNISFISDSETFIFKTLDENTFDKTINERLEKENKKSL